MDNLSHSLAGLAAAELVQRALAPESDPASQSLRRRMLLLCGLLACNFPDLDLLWKNLLAPPLGYLLHHRGHTHTLLYLLPQALVLIALLWLLWPTARRLLARSAQARRGLLLATGAGLLLHLLMDFLNSYGVHPFYPFDGRWVYGDAVFILEPLFWVALGAPLAAMVPRPMLRGALLAGLLLILVWAGGRHYLDWAAVLLLAGAGAMLAWWQAKTNRRRVLGAGFLLCLAFIGMQTVQSQRAKALVAQELQRRDPASMLRDVALSAFPSQPLCWIFISVEHNQAAATFRIRRGQVALAAGTACPAGLSEGPDDGSHDGSQIRMTLEHEAPLSALRAMQASCGGKGWLRFARMPLLSDGTASDARFSMDNGKNFTSIPLEGLDRFPCEGMPAWGVPRADLLAGPSQSGAR